MSADKSVELAAELEELQAPRLAKEKEAAEVERLQSAIEHEKAIQAFDARMDAWVGYKPDSRWCAMGMHKYVDTKDPRYVRRGHLRCLRCGVDGYNNGY